MSMKKSEKREAAFLLLYQSLLNNDSIDEIVAANIDEFELKTDATVTAKVLAVQEYAEQADSIIEEYSKSRKIARIPRASLSILRLALYEMNCDDTVPAKAAMNEAIELIKKYGVDEDRKFVSGLLGNYYRSKTGES